MARPRIGLLAVGFRGLDQAVKLSTGRRALGPVAEQPVFSSDHEEANRAFSSVIFERQIAFFDISLQPAPVTGKVTDGFAQSVLSSDLWLRLFDPAFQLSQYWQALLVTTDLAFGIAASLQVAFDAIKLVDQIQRDIRASRFTFRLYFRCVNELATRMGPAR